MYFTGICIAIMTFLTIGIWHPIVIKTEYYWGTRPWVIYLVVGFVCLISALFIENVYASSFLGVFGASALWGIGELFSQKKRVEKGWFPKNPKRIHEYQQIDKDETLCPIHHGKSIYTVKDNEDTADSCR
ncbi:MAG: DUF4491 family protein [Prevotella sp.]|mgnify:CR=1 FL=1|nr:DUF4491 family protein [Prevotella sp.]MBQ9650316.1 DUF4491 family protein [Prevotella sp.]